MDPGSWKPYGDTGKPKFETFCKLFLQERLEKNPKKASLLRCLGSESSSLIFSVCVVETNP